jgi:hypothetical protein
VDIFQFVTIAEPDGFCEHCGDGYYVVYEYDCDGVTYCPWCMVANGEITKVNRVIWLGMKNNENPVAT